MFESAALSSQQGRRDHRIERNVPHLDPMIFEDGHVVVGVVSDLRDGFALEQRSKGFHYVRLGKLPTLAVPNGDVPSRARLCRERQSNQFCSHRVDGRRLGVERESLRGFDLGYQPVERFLSVHHTVIDFMDVRVDRHGLLPVARQFTGRVGDTVHDARELQFSKEADDPRAVVPPEPSGSEVERDRRVADYRRQYLAFAELLRPRADVPLCPWRLDLIDMGYDLLDVPELAH